MATPLPAPSLMDKDDEIDVIEYWDIVVDNRWLIAAITLFVTIVGLAYASMARPVYEANLLIQVEDSSGSTKNLLGDSAAGLLDVKTGATAELEILRSRMVVGQAVDNTLFYIYAKPRYLPVIGNWLARRSKTLSDPGFLGFGGFVTGTEKIAVGAFNVPQSLEGSSFRVTARGKGRYTLTHPGLPQPLDGIVGAPLVRSTPYGTISLLVSAMDAKPNAEFDVRRLSRLATTNALQGSLRLSEKGRQSGVIDASLQSDDPIQLTTILNAIGHQYVRQNVERRAEEAQKMLAFLDVQMPQFKKQLDQSEQTYTNYRNQHGTVSLDEESRIILNRSVDLHNKLLEAQQKRLELTARFTPEHPLVKTLDEQMSAWNREVANLNAAIRNMPTIQQDALRLERDVKVNNEAYQNLRNNAMQLQLIREGKVGNVRLIDEAVVPEQPVAPKRTLIATVAVLLGLLTGVGAAIARSALSRGIRDPQEIEAATGLNVYSTIPLSSEQHELARRAMNKERGLHLLAALSPRDAAVESLRSLRTALQFAMLEAPNNIVLITGATPGVGKSFVSANFAAILASAGKRVLLVDADLRKGHLNNFFGVARENGFSEAVAGSVSTSDVIHREVLPHLDLLTTGLLPPNPAELMASAALANLLEGLSSQYDLVLVDTPPVLAAADTLGIAAQAGTLLLVARSGQTQIGEIHESAKRLSQVGRSVSGILFNAIDLSRRHYGSYGYKYGGYRYRHYSYQSVAAQR
jgi:tyrosine-protein kinase Etk/Wzc